MRAVVCVPDGTEVGEVPDPVAGPGKVVVEVEACGLCGSDVHAIENGMTQPGQVLGHEFGGRVTEVGAGVTGWRAGQPVAVNPLGSCGTCRACTAGTPFACAALPNIGLSAPGAYAEYISVPANQLVALPDGLPVEKGAHAEPLAVALQAVSQAAVGPGDTVLVHGVGSIGLNAIMGLKLAGVDHIVGAGRSPGRRAAATAVGADDVIDTRQTSLADYVASSGRRFAAVLDCSGATGLFAETVGLLEPGGAFVEVALTSDVPSVNLFGLVQGGLRVYGTCAYSYANFEAAVDHIAAGRVPVDAIITERVSLDQTPDALQRLRKPGELVRLLSLPRQRGGGAPAE
ncbi:MAG: alcohol dehydrogenase catalytic domain-containing protein [Actinobacteria bacterium]|nr:alcohol dehydrogenase catalytic domain-containing protein [Actinomycetota bacterium]